MSKGAYYFPLYYQRILATCSGWKDDEFGAYLKLLIYQFDKGSLPNDMKILSRIGTSVKKNWHLLSTKFIVQEDGTLINEVMAEIRLKYIDKQEINIENGSKGGRPKKNRPVINSETENKPNGFENESGLKGIPITNNQYPNIDYLKGSGLVPEMLKGYKAHFSDYPHDEIYDYPALLEIAGKIAKYFRFPKDKILTDYSETISFRWGELVFFAQSDSWFADKPITFLNKNFQNLLQKFLKTPAAKNESRDSKPTETVRERHDRELLESINGPR